MSALIAVSPLLSWAVIILGLSTAILASLAGSVQADIKSALSYASLAQVGIIVAEIGLGLPWVALVHIIGHACLRTLQFLRAPSLIQDHQRLSNAVGGRLGGPMGLLLPERAAAWLYRFSIERGSLDVLLWDWLARPFVRLLQWLDRLDRRWAGLVGGEQEEPRP
jgi:NAD(P)H-quinone oxidoreductase subunit 5